ncbi:C-signal-like [Dysidea avara]|uniref:C-signal-like n=1 Tax=Dysidea avara TaxID=196820 RepID=UPI00332D2F0C
MATIPYSIMITGANQGVGLGLVKYLLASNPRPHHMIAASRNLGGEGSKELEDLAAKEDCLSVVKLDVTKPDTFAAVVGEIDGIVQEKGLNVLINNAGIYLRKGLEDVTAEDMLLAFSTHAVGALMLTKACLPLLKRAASRLSTKALGWQRAAVINMSSRLGSISDNTSGGSYSYRASKAALNAVTKSLSIDIINDGIIACVIHPGWAKTSMGGPDGLISVDESVQGLMKVFAGLDENSNGGFFRYDDPNNSLSW